MLKKIVCIACRDGAVRVRRDLRGVRHRPLATAAARSSTSRSSRRSRARSARSSASTSSCTTICRPRPMPTSSRSRAYPRPAPTDRTRRSCGSSGRPRRAAPGCSASAAGRSSSARPGILDGRRSTTHWMYTDDLAEAFPGTTVDPDVLFVEDRHVVTGAGTAAGIDAALHIVRRELGAAAANIIARRMVVPPQRDGGQSQYIQPPAATAPSDSFAAVTDWMLQNLDQELTVDQLARTALMSPRTFARRFRAELGTTPTAWLNRQRLLRAQQLLEETDSSLEIDRRRHRLRHRGGDAAPLRQGAADDADGVSAHLRRPPGRPRADADARSERGPAAPATADGGQEDLAGAGEGERALVRRDVDRFAPGQRIDDARAGHAGTRRRCRARSPGPVRVTCRIGTAAPARSRRRRIRRHPMCTSSKSGTSGRNTRTPSAGVPARDRAPERVEVEHLEQLVDVDVLGGEAAAQHVVARRPSARCRARTGRRGCCRPAGRAPRRVSA